MTDFGCLMIASLLPYYVELYEHHQRIVPVLRYLQPDVPGQQGI